MTVKKTTRKVKKTSTTTKRKSNKKSEPKVLEWGREEVIESKKVETEEPLVVEMPKPAEETMSVPQTPSVDTSSAVSTQTTTSIDGFEIEKPIGLPTASDPVGILSAPEIPNTGDEKKPQFKLIWIGLGVAVLVVIIGVGGYFLMNKKTPTPTVSLPTPTPMITVAVTPTPTEAPLPEIIILNATGISGLAGKLAGLLETEGFTEVTTGNSNLKVVGNMVNLPVGASMSASLSSALTKIDFAPFEVGVSASDKIELIIGK